MSQNPSENPFGRVDDAHETGRRRLRALELLAEEAALVAPSEHRRSGADLSPQVRTLEPAPFARIDEETGRSDDATALMQVQTEQIAALLDERQRQLAESKAKLDQAWEDLRLAEADTKAFIATETNAIKQISERARIDREELRTRLDAIEAAEADHETRREQWSSERTRVEARHAAKERELSIRESGLIDWEDRLKAFQSALETLEARRREDARAAIELLRAQEQQSVARAAAERAQIDRLAENQRKRRTALDERERRLAASERALATRRSETAQTNIPDARGVLPEALEAEKLRQEAAGLLREALKHRLAIGELWTGLVDRAGAAPLHDALEETRRRLAREFAAEQRRLDAAHSRWQSAIARLSSWAATQQKTAAESNPQPFYGS